MEKNKFFKGSWRMLTEEEDHNLDYRELETERKVELLEEDATFFAEELKTVKLSNERNEEDKGYIDRVGEFDSQARTPNTRNGEKI